MRKRLAVELDGDSHFTDETIQYDRERTAYLNALNKKVLRFLNTDVYENLNAAGERILKEIRGRKPVDMVLDNHKCKQAETTARPAEVGPSNNEGAASRILALTS